MGIPVVSSARCRLREGQCKRTTSKLGGIENRESQTIFQSGVMSGVRESRIPLISDAGGVPVSGCLIVV